jgi:hypothetical protein
MNLEQEFQYAEYLSHTYCYPEFLHGELSTQEQKRTNQSPSPVPRHREGQAEVSPLFQSKHREGQRAARVSKLSANFLRSNR